MAKTSKRGKGGQDPSAARAEGCEGCSDAVSQTGGDAAVGALAIPLRQLAGLGQGLRGLGEVIIGCTDALQRLTDVKPEPKIGKRQPPDYRRYRRETPDAFVYENRYVLVSGSQPVGCGEENKRVLEWNSYKEDKSRPCSTLSGAEIQAYISEQIAAAKAAAAPLCTSEDCPTPETVVTFQGWDCTGHDLWVYLQLELTCKSEA
jgi:hypothetical protein